MTDEPQIYVLENVREGAGKKKNWSAIETHLEMYTEFSVLTGDFHYFPCYLSVEAEYVWRDVYLEEGGLVVEGLVGRLVLHLQANLLQPQLEGFSLQ